MMEKANILILAMSQACFQEPGILELSAHH